MRLDRIKIVEYDARWPALFEQQRRRVEPVLAETGWQSWLAFRDHLRATPADREEYARIKRELAAADAQDRPAYRAGKAPFITGVLSRLGPSHTPGG